jgi:hypothetical protein
MALIGNGAQSEFQALAFHHLLGIEEIRAVRCRSRGHRKLMRNLRTPGCAWCCLRQRGRGRARSRYSDHRDRRQNQRHHHHAGHARAGHAHQRGRRRLPGQDRTARRRVAGRFGICGIRAADPHRRRSAADAGRLCGDRTVASVGSTSAWPHQCAQVTVFDSVGFRAGRLFGPALHA